MEISTYYLNDKMPLKNEISIGRCLSRDILKQKLKIRYFKRLMWNNNTQGLLLTLIFILAITYCCNDMGSAKDNTSQKENDKVYIQTSYVPVSGPTFDIDCRMFSCFNYTRCPLTGGFPIYVYNRDLLYNGNEGVTIPIKELLSANNYITPNPAEACIFLVITELPYRDKDMSIESNKIVFNTLPHWGRDGRNHVLLNLGQSTLATGTGSAIIAQSTFTHRQFRPGFDVVIPPAHGPINGEVWNISPPISSARIHLLSKDEERLLEYRIDEWSLSDNRKSRRSRLQISTFSLIIAPRVYVYASTNMLQTRLYEALESGAIPVILGGDGIRLPYEEVLDWRKAVIRLPMARASELKFVLENMIDEDILAFRKHGRMLWERYLGSLQASVDTLLAVIRTRLNLPPRPVKSKIPRMYDYLGNDTKEIKSFETSEEIAALNVQPTTYKRNFTVGLLNGYELWNLWGDPFALYPELPWDPILPPEARYLNSSVSKRYHDICSPLAGDWPKENFTVIILTYKRKTLLDDDISRLSKMPYLHKIVVVCNGPKPSTKGWPTNVPIALVQPPHNSLSNRFLPYDLIETEAVFSVDDDAVPLDESEIIFAFKVWREHRDQIVGFFGRNYGLDNKLENGFTYNINYKGKTACDVSMALTGAAFIHRYYLWAYWRQLPVSVRQFVDKHNNCEDIAMNFLVAHITRKPPIKVTSEWAEEKENTIPSYRRLSARSSHYQNRKACIDFFSKVIGYNPLINTHYRVETFPKAKFWFWENMIRGQIWDM